MNEDLMRTLFKYLNKFMVLFWKLGLIESHPHDITITREAPNYQRGDQ